MSNEEDISNNSDYDEDSFDHESIEELTDEDVTISDMSESDQSVEDQLQANFKQSNDDEDTELSSLNSEDDDNADSETLKKNVHQLMTGTQTTRANQTVEHSKKNDHEIVESDTDVMSELEEKAKNLQIQPNMNHSEKKITSDNECNDHDDAENLSDCDQSGVEVDIGSQTPSSFNSDEHAFHVDIIRRPTRSNITIHQGSRNANRKSLSFTNDRMREIERDNQILLRKILTQKPRKENLSYPNLRTTTSAINRKKQQRQIDLDNQVLKRKLEAISLRRRQNIYHL